ncbi:hypothetical protein [uncultured Desulfobulbus sp.]|uniref:hypothetical protein n=1 Tax=uncultured Desulfobulbus sp. TaxID=239745 RepID=UPI0029C68B67|nr:hypothetical protein [uncultured Desulfobulbus sp.]
MKRTVLLLTVLSFLTLPALAIGQTPSDHSQHAMPPPQGDHGTMPMMNKQTIMLGEQTIEGVKGMAHLNDVGAVMAQMGKKENYHFMVMFSDAKTGAAIEQGTVAVKITDPKTGQTGEAIPLMGMGGHFGVDVSLLAKGEYQFQVGSKLADGSKRQFTFHYTLK